MLNTHLSHHNQTKTYRCNLINKTFQYELWAGCPRSQVEFPLGARDFSPPHNILIGSGTTQPPIHWVSRAVPYGIATDVKVTSYLHLVLRLRMVELYVHSLIHLHGVVHS
jgi:hypothetical protein